MHRLTPERSIQIQNDLGADIIMCFDQFVPGTEPAEAQQAAFDRTLRWAEQSKTAHQRSDDQSLFGIVQAARTLTCVPDAPSN